ncbi:MAG TPA: hypothetical protein PLY93_08570 [Turneriella sp.]|nr:hypothetical protein [Turneriella sp.]
MEKRSIKIMNILEVHLPPIQWERIVSLAVTRKKTFSTITRYCVLRLARKKNLCWNPVLITAHSKAKGGVQITDKVHRHVVCLYGEDEMLIRLAAMHLRITMSAFIRLSLELFLGHLAMEKQGYNFVTDEQLKWQAIRFIERYTPHTQNCFSRPDSIHFKWFNFALSSYW